MALTKKSFFHISLIYTMDPWTSKMSMHGSDTNLRGRLSMVDLPIKVACFVEKLIMFSTSKAANLN